MEYETKSRPTKLLKNIEIIVSNFLRSSFRIDELKLIQLRLKISFKVYYWTWYS